MNWFFTLRYVKNKYRQSILEQRKALSIQEQLDLSSKIQEKFFSFFPWKNIQVLGAYMPINNEVNLESLFQDRANENLITTVPMIAENDSMQLITLDFEKKLALNKFNIPEPLDGEVIEVAQHDLIIVPALGVDRYGFRLGYGGGYYDKFLMPIMKSKRRPKIIGLLYDFQFINTEISERHDIRFDFVFSETNIKNFT